MIELHSRACEHLAVLAVEKQEYRLCRNRSVKRGGGRGKEKGVSIGLPPPVAVFASPVPEPSIRCHQGHEGSRWRGDVVGTAWGEGGGADRGQGKVRGWGATLKACQCQ